VRRKVENIMEARKTVPHPHLDNKAKASVRRVL
jgi:hypothetical protein